MEYLYLKWIDYRTNKKYLIGALFRDKEKGKYYFKMSRKHVEKAIQEKAISLLIRQIFLHHVLQMNNYKLKMLR